MPSLDLHFHAPSAPNFTTPLDCLVDPPLHGKKMTSIGDRRSVSDLTTLSTLSRYETLKSYRRGPTNSLNSRDLSILKFQASLSRPLRHEPADIQCRHFQAESLKQDLMESSRARGVCSNLKLSEDELAEFRHAYKEVSQNREGLTRSELVESFLDNHIFPCKRDALALSKLMPRTSRGLITSDVLIEASDDVALHQRRKLQRYIRSLPLPEEDRVRPQSR
jgi:hypothetical protein